MLNNDFSSKEFIHINNTSIIASIVDFIKNNIEDKVEIGYSIDKKVNAKSLLKVMALLSNNNNNINIYCYGNKKEDNLKTIEDFLYDNNLCSMPEIKNIEQERINSYDKELEEEILSVTPDNKRKNIKSKINLLKEKRSKKHGKYSENHNIIYIKNNKKIEIINFIENDITEMIKNLSSYYEINIEYNYIENLKIEITDALKSINIQYFYKDIFFNCLQKYFIDKFDKIYIKKIIDEDYTNEIKYNTEYINKIIKESVKTLDYILKNKRELSYNISNIYLNNFNYANIKSSIISIINNISVIYELEYKLINDDLISFASKISNSIGENLLSGMGSSGNILIQNIINYFQKQFEYAYISSIIGEDSPIIEYDFNYIKRFI